MHDITMLESYGLPGVFVASTEFVQAARAQAAALGADPSAVFVSHPIQDRTDDELYALANDAADAVLDALTTAGPSLFAPS